MKLIFAFPKIFISILLIFTLSACGGGGGGGGGGNPPDQDRDSGGGEQVDGNGDQGDTNDGGDVSDEGDTNDGGDVSDEGDTNDGGDVSDEGDTNDGDDVSDEGDTGGGVIDGGDTGDEGDVGDEDGANDGGDVSDGGDSDDQTDGGDDVASINGGASGYLYYAEDNKIIRHDLATGEKADHINTNLPHVIEAVSVSDDGSMFAVIDDIHRFVDVFDSNSNLLLHIEGRIDPSFDYSRYVPPILFSPNNKYYLLYRSEVDIDSEDLLIRDLSGKTVGFVEGLFDYVYGWDWISNEQILYSQFGSIFRQQISEEGETVGEPEELIQLNSASSDMSVSPDGTKLAFILGGTSVHVMNIDGGGETMIADSNIIDSNGDIDYLGAVRWSPDGSSIMVTSDGDFADAQGNPGCAIMSIIPANPDSVIDLLDPQYWVVEKTDSGFSPTCQQHMYSFGWLAQ